MTRSQPAASPSNVKVDPWLPRVRLFWLILAGLIVATFLVSIPSLVAQLQTPCAAAPCAGWRLTAGDAQALQRQNVSTSFYAAFALALNTLLILPFLGVSALMVWRKSRDRSAMIMALILAAFAAAGAINLLSTVWNLPDAIWQMLIATSSVLLFFLFPNGKFVPRWTRWAALVPSFSILTGLLIPQWAEALSGITSIASYLAGISAQIYRYRRVSTGLERQQTKWAVFGIGLAITGFISLSLTAGFFPQTGVIASGGLASLAIDTGWPLSYSLIPLSIGVAILRSHLYEIDVIIRRTLIYGALTALLAAVYFGGVALSQVALTPLTGGKTNDLGVVASTLGIAALFQPLRRAVQGLIDRRFYRRKYDAARTVAAFGAQARDEVELEQLTARLVAVVDETMRPAAVSLCLPKTPAAAPRSWRPGA